MNFKTRNLNKKLKQGVPGSSGSYAKKLLSWGLFAVVMYFLYFELDTAVEKIAAAEAKVSKKESDDPFGYLVSKSSKA